MTVKMLHPRDWRTAWHGQIRIGRMRRGGNSSEHLMMMNKNVI
jgi:hypothetical protein